MPTVYSNPTPKNYWTSSERTSNSPPGGSVGGDRPKQVGAGRVAATKRWFLQSPGSMAKRVLIAMPGGARFDPKVRAELATAKVVNRLVEFVKADLDGPQDGKDGLRLEKNAYYGNLRRMAADMIDNSPELKGGGEEAPHRAVVDALAVLFEQKVIDEFQVKQVLMDLPKVTLVRISSQHPSGPGAVPGHAKSLSVITGAAQYWLNNPPKAASASAPHIVDRLGDGDFEEMQATFANQRLRPGLEVGSILCAWTDISMAHQAAVGMNDPKNSAEKQAWLASSHAAAMENCRKDEKSIPTHMVAYYKFYETKQSSALFRTPPPGHYLLPAFKAVELVGGLGAPTQLTTRPALMFQTAYKDLLDPKKCPDDKARSTYVRKFATELITVQDAKVKAIDDAILELGKLADRSGVDTQLRADAKELLDALKGIREDFDGKSYSDLQTFARLAQAAPGAAAKMVMSIGQRSAPHTQAG